MVILKANYRTVQVKNIFIGPISDTRYYGRGGAEDFRYPQTCSRILKPSLGLSFLKTIPDLSNIFPNASRIHSNLRKLFKAHPHVFQNIGGQRSEVTRWFMKIHEGSLLRRGGGANVNGTTTAMNWTWMERCPIYVNLNEWTKSFASPPGIYVATPAIRLYTWVNK